MQKARFILRARVEAKKLEAAVEAYIKARQKAGKLPLEEDVMHLIQQHTHLIDDLQPQREDDTD